VSQAGSCSVREALQQATRRRAIPVLLEIFEQTQARLVLLVSIEKFPDIDPTLESRCGTRCHAHFQIPGTKPTARANLSKNVLRMSSMD
jgi:hypothetical protein